MPIASEGMPPDYQFSERDKKIERIQSTLQDTDRLAETIDSLEWSHRRDIITNLCKGIRALLEEELGLEKEPGFKSSNQVAEALIKQALTWLEYDSQSRNITK